MSQCKWITIPSELIGSIPRPDDLLEATINYESDVIPREVLHEVQLKAIEATVRELDAITGSPVVTDGEQTKPSFLTYPIYELIYERYRFDDKCFKIAFSDGHIRTLPRLIKAPFRYATFAHKYLDVARRFTKKPIKQAVITASALSMVYSPTLLNMSAIDDYSREQFLRDLCDECEKDVRLCLDHGAHVVQLDFTEARLSLKVDPSGQLLKEFIAINNRVLDRFNTEQQKKIGVHVCPGGDCDSYHSYEIDYTLMLPDLFKLHLTNFYLQLSSEKDHVKILKCIQQHMKPNHRIFVGVVDPVSPKIETAEIVRDRILEAAQYIPWEQLGTTDDCGYSPFADDRSTSRDLCYAKVKARIEGTKLAEQILNSRKN
ncbi:unnamed protein product [Didymodactylos carnosus]|uniref:Cobalamin-independent methionine synthase MetE C-terminal/archaeal domain-containing protein n=1 Tax=Didymodactylos carnosus TaxID=1234261 RepID=A0A814EQR8_9BILA|nr:unnamed protein product [Didymodactylos carnosus]CAF0972695.1 unnamed protein product [Didymodactylos carnosus]CAF3631451.1 unnamed protein product [Didymodactylos carnosus]CAF3745661.1 unnamed protein product [Didymodactylos carnosus]